MLSVAFQLCLSVYFLPAVLRSSSVLLLYSISYLRVLATIVFPLSLCTQPPCFRGGRSAVDATPLFVWFAWRRTAVPFASLSVLVG